MRPDGFSDRRDGCYSVTATARLVLLLSTKYKEWNDKRNDGTTGMNGAVTSEIWNVMECFCCGLLDWSYGMGRNGRRAPYPGAALGVL